MFFSLSTPLSLYIAILLLTFTFSISSPNSLSIPISHFYGRFYIDIIFPKQNTSLQTKLSLQNRTNSFPNIYQTEPDFSQLHSEQITISNTTTSLHFYVISIDPLYARFNTDISFSYNNHLNFFSLIDNLHKDKLISNKNFIINPKEQKLLLGSGNDDIKYNYYSHCKIKDNQWGCKLNNVYIVDNYTETNVLKYHNTHSMKFEANNGDIYAPRDFMEKLNKTLFDDLVNNDKCFYDDYHPELIKIGCGFMAKLTALVNKTIQFEIEGTIYSMDLIKMFAYFDSYKGFEISENPHNANEWILGGYFLEKYITEFNYDHKQITFYTDTSLIKSNIHANPTTPTARNEYTNLKSKSYIFLSIGLLLSLIFPLYIKLYFPLNNSL